MKYFLDFEFIEDGKTIDMVSVGIVAEDGREYYAVSKQFNRVRLFDDPWLADNVAPHLPWVKLSSDNLSWVAAEPDTSTGLWKNRDIIAGDILTFCDPLKYGKPEFWGYYADYDWVTLCQLYGRMIDLPKGWPMYCRDLKQLADDRGNPKLPKQEVEHNALEDARWNRDMFTLLSHHG